MKKKENRQLREVYMYESANDDIWHDVVGYVEEDKKINHQNSQEIMNCLKIVN